MMMNQDHEHYDEPLEMPVVDIFRSLSRRRRPFVIAVLLILLLGAIGMAVAYLSTPFERVASVPFRLEFQGVETRVYPSGVAFSTGDIVATPVIRAVFERNDLQRYLEFSEFSGSLFVVEENEALRNLMAEYRAKLADPKLSHVDRSRLEQEFELKRESTSRNSYELHLILQDIEMPAVLIEKVLRDILDTWADYAEEEKGATRYQLPVLSTNVLPDPGDDPIVALDSLRSRIWDLIQTSATLRRIPGGEGLRSGSGLSVAEIQIKFEDVLRMHVHPLLDEFVNGRYAADRAQAIQYIESQLAHSRILQENAKRRVDTLRESLSLYNQGETATIEVSPSSSGSATNPVETINPFLAETFLDRIVDFAALSEDRSYRQGLVDRIAEEALRQVPRDLEVAFYEQYLSQLRSGEQGTHPAAASRSLERAVAEVRNLIGQTAEIYRRASENLNASRLLFSVTAPMTITVDRAIEGSQILLAGVLFFLLAIPAAAIGVILYDRVYLSRASHRDVTVES